MKNESKDYVGTWRYDYYGIPGLSEPFTLTEDHSSGFDRVSSDPVLNGDFRTPLPWNYIASKRRDWKATKIIEDLISPSDGPAYWRTTARFSGNQSASSDSPFYPNFDSNLAYNSALDSLNKKTRGELNLAVDLAEVGSTTRMLSRAAYLLNPRHLVKAGVNLLLPKKRIKPPNRGFYRDSLVGFGSTKDIANGYVEYKYGWKPTMQSIFDAADESIRVVEKRLASVSGYGTQYPDLDGPDSVVSSSFTRTKVSGTAKVMVRITVKLDPFQGFDILRWTSLNPIGLAWELVPLSFVVDWVYDVGSYLQNLETALLYQTRFVSGFQSTTFVADLKQSVAGSKVTYLSSTSRSTLLNGECSRRIRQQSRIILNNYPIPDRPTFNVDLGSSQLLSAAALLRQRLRF